MNIHHHVDYRKRRLSKEPAALLTHELKDVFWFIVVPGILLAIFVNL